MHFLFISLHFIHLHPFIFPTFFQVYILCAYTPYVYSDVAPLHRLFSSSSFITFLLSSFTPYSSHCPRASEPHTVLFPTPTQPRRSPDGSSSPPRGAAKRAIHTMHSRRPGPVRNPPGLSVVLGGNEGNAGNAAGFSAGFNLDVANNTHHSHTPPFIMRPSGGGLSPHRQTVIPPAAML